MIYPRVKSKAFLSVQSFSFLVYMGLFFGLLGESTSTSAAERFPLYPCIQVNVNFWEAIYSRYSTRQGILHDSENLGRIYAVIDLVDWKLPGSAALNSARIKTAKDRIKTILISLGSNQPARTVEEKRIAALFPRQRHTTFHEAAENIRLQLGQKDRFHEGLIRSGKYLAQFRQIFTAQGLPPELVYLPHVESSFNPKAYSKAGAAGLWQFTRSTGKDYLVINELVDERYDPYLATEAAARLLKENYAALQSWPLAITAYNYGRAGMMRAVQARGNYEKIFTSYNQGYFKFAARNFYSEFLAAMRVAKRLSGQPTLPFERPEATMTFRLKADTPVDRLHASFALSREQFARLNPALLQPVTSGKKPVPKGYLVRLPAAKRPKQVPSGRKLSASHRRTRVTYQC